MAIEVERECTGYKYTAEEDIARLKWSVTTDYINQAVYISQPDCDKDLDHLQAFGRAIVKACQSMRKDIKNNRLDV